MRFGRSIIIVGTILIFFGIVFQFQGRGQLGPESSFMYHNEDWISHGMIIVAAGIIISGFGVFLSRR